MYGVVTTGSEWIFVRWTGDSKKPKIEMTRKFTCNFTTKSDFDTANNIIAHIAGILESQVEVLEDQNKRIRISGSESKKDGGRKGDRIGRKGSRSGLSRGSNGGPCSK